jgi:hypothetical protein
MNKQVKHNRVSLYVQRWLSADIKMEDDHNSVLNASKRKFKFPTVELKKFGGDIKDWLFWGQFKKINKDPETDDAGMVDMALHQLKWALVRLV